MESDCRREGAGEAYGTATYICEYGGTCFQRRRGSYVAFAEICLIRNRCLSGQKECGENTIEAPGDHVLLFARKS